MPLKLENLFINLVLVFLPPLTTSFPVLEQNNYLAFMSVNKNEQFDIQTTTDIFIVQDDLNIGPGYVWE